MQVEVAYAKPEEQSILPIDVPIECTALEAIELSGILARYPEIDLAKNKIGIFSQICTFKTRLHENDRVEIYRKLTLDPMQARRQRAIQQQLG